MSRFFLLLVFLATAPLAQAQQIPVTTASDDARMQYVRGEVDFFNSQGTKARAHFDAAIAADPSFAMAHAYRAAATPPADSDARDEHLRLAMQHSASVTEAERQWIAAIQAGIQGDIEAQNEILRALTEEVPDDPRPLLFLSYSESSLGNPAAAVAAGRRARAADPSFSPTFNALGYAEMANGNMGAAEAAFQEQIRLAPGFANPHDSYGDYFMATDQLDEAEEQFRLALTHNPEFELSRTKLTRIAIMRAYAAEVAAYNRNDPDALAGFFTENAVVSPPGRSQVIGRDAIREVVSTMFASSRMTAEAETQEIIPMGDGFAYQRALSTERSSDGEEYRSIETMIWVETPEGWKISRYSWTPAPATP